MVTSEDDVEVPLHLATQYASAADNVKHAGPTDGFQAMKVFVEMPKACAIL